MATIKEKVEKVFQNIIGEEFSRENILDLVIKAFPGTNGAKRHSI